MYLNSHIDTRKIDTYSRNAYSLTSDEELVNFKSWLDNQPVKILFLQDALKAYRNPEAAKPTIVTETKKKTYSIDDFKSNHQLNSFLRRNGFTWHKIAPMNEYEESRFGESYRWQLYSSDDRAVTVNDALEIIAKVRNEY